MFAICDTAIGASRSLSQSQVRLLPMLRNRQCPADSSLESSFPGFYRVFTGYYRVLLGFFWGGARDLDGRAYGAGWRRGAESVDRNGIDQSCVEAFLFFLFLASSSPRTVILVSATCAGRGRRRSVAGRRRDGGRRTPAPVSAASSASLDTPDAALRVPSSFVRISDDVASPNRVEGRRC